MICAEMTMHHANCCIVTGASTTSWSNQMWEVCASGLMTIRKHLHARHQTRRHIVMGTTVAAMVIDIFAEMTMHHAKCCIVTGAGTTSWSDQMWKVCASGLMTIRKHLHARHQTRRHIVMGTTVA